MYCCVSCYITQPRFAKNVKKTLFASVLAVLSALHLVLTPTFYNTFVIHEWSSRLLGFEQYDYVMAGIQTGFDIGIMHESVPPIGYNTAHTFPISAEHAIPAQDWIIKGNTNEYMLGPFTITDPKLAHVWMTPIFVVGRLVERAGELVQRWRPIHHLSWPKNHDKWDNVNKLIKEDMKHVSYVTLYDVVKMVNHMGPGKGRSPQSTGSSGRRSRPRR